MSTETIEYRSPAIEKVPLRERINFRMIFFIAFIALLVGYPVYWMVKMQVTGGIEKVAGGYTYVDLKAMSTFTFDQNNGTINDIPAKWRELDGKKVVLHGEMGAGMIVSTRGPQRAIPGIVDDEIPVVLHGRESRRQAL